MTSFVEAEAAIRQLHARYIDSVWRKDVDAFGDCFAPDCEWRITGKVYRGRDEIQEMISHIFTRARRILMTFQTPILEVGDGTASGRTYVQEQCAWENGNSNIAIGRYYEHFVEDADRWRFSWRLFQVHYSGPPDLSAQYRDHPDFGAPPGMPERDVLTTDKVSPNWK